LIAFSATFCLSTLTAIKSLLACLMIRLSDAVMRQRESEAVYPDHPPSPCSPKMRPHDSLKLPDYLRFEARRIVSYIIEPLAGFLTVHRQSVG